MVEIEHFGNYSKPNRKGTHLAMAIPKSTQDTGEILTPATCSLG